MAGYLLIGGLMFLVALGGLVMFKLSDDARANAEAELAASQVQNDLGRLMGIPLEVQQSGWTPHIQAEVAEHEKDLDTNLRILGRLGLDTGGTASLMAQATSFLAIFDQTVVPALRGDPGAAGPQATLPDATQLDFATERVMRELNQASAAAAGPRRLVLLLTLPAIALLVAATLWWDSRRRRHAELERAHAASHARFEAMVEEGSDLVVLANQDGEVSYVSSSLTHVLGIEPEAWLGKQALNLFETEDRTTVAEALESVVLTGKCDPVDVRFLHADGTWRVLEVTGKDLSSNPDVGCIVWHGRDVTEGRRLEEELARQAFRDSLTGLANRALFQDRLTHGLARAARSSEQVGVLMLDLDGFKTVNDTMGHDAGDEVLVEIAARLGACVRPGDTVARPGGDEFTILLEDMDNPPEIEVIAARVVERLGKPLTVQGHELRLTASVGIALSNDEPQSAQKLLRNADLAMYAAKSRGKNNYVCFEPSMHADAEDALGVSVDLSRALARGEFFVHYQPTISLVTGEVEGAEALLRWNHPDRGVVPPLAFIPIAERSGDIVAIGRWVLEQACEQAARWAEQFPDMSPFSMNVNVSGRQLIDPSFLADVASTLERTRLAPRSLTLEITETIFVTGSDEVVGRLEELKALGVSLAIDDFGTGYSSLAYLSRFPFDILKIDKAFVDAASTGAPGGEALIKAIVDIGSGLHLKTVAEGIEQPAQASHMRVLGCDAGQGYLFARPMPSDEFTELLRFTRPPVPKATETV